MPNAQTHLENHEGPQNIKGDDLSHDERLATLDRGHYLIIDGRIIAHRDALVRAETKQLVPPQTKVVEEKPASNEQAATETEAPR